MILTSPIQTSVYVKLAGALLWWLWDTYHWRAYRFSGVRVGVPVHSMKCYFVRVYENNDRSRSITVDWCVYVTPSMVSSIWAFAWRIETGLPPKDKSRSRHGVELTAGGRRKQVGMSFIPSANYSTATEKTRRVAKTEVCISLAQKISQQLRWACIVDMFWHGDHTLQNYRYSIEPKNGAPLLASIPILNIYTHILWFCFLNVISTSRTSRL